MEQTFRALEKGTRGQRPINEGSFGTKTGASKVSLYDSLKLKIVEQNRLAQEQIRVEKEKVESDITQMIAENEKAWEVHQNSARKYCDDLFDQIQNASRRKIEEIERINAEDEANRVIESIFLIFLAIIDTL